MLGFRLVELQGVPDGLEHLGRWCGGASLLELGVVAGIDPRPRCHLDATQSAGRAPPVRMARQFLGGRAEGRPLAQLRQEVPERTLGG